MNDKVNVRAKLQQFDELWSPKVVGRLNGQMVKLVKLLGEFVWHRHEHEDELFWVLDGRLELHFRDQVVDLQPGEFFIVPRGVEHKPVAAALTEVLLFEPDATRNTGDADDPRTVEAADLDAL